jgi:hypothetical protein
MQQSAFAGLEWAEIREDKAAKRKAALTMTGRKYQSN